MYDGQYLGAGGEVVEGGAEQEVGSGGEQARVPLDLVQQEPFQHRE